MTPISPHPPYIWFGGKRKIAPLVWSALGDVANYIEPFFGGGAVWLLRPHEPRIETVNDYDGFVANFWRAVQAEPEAVAEAMNRPLNEVDLEAIHRSLCRMPDKAEFLERMKHDPQLYDVQRAAWWCWGLNAWIGRGWCGGEYWPGEKGRSRGCGVCDGANKLPHIAAGRGVHRKRPRLGNAGAGEHERRGQVLRDWMLAIRDRIRNVRVCCGDWARVCTGGATTEGSTVGVFLDPPYSHDAGRETNIYREESADVAKDCLAWCVERTAQSDRKWSCGPGGRIRVVLAGYDSEHNSLEQLGWRVVAWKTHGGYAHYGKAKHGKANTHRERLWISPSCEVANDATLFAADQ